MREVERRMEPRTPAAPRLREVVPVPPGARAVSCPLCNERCLLVPLRRPGSDALQDQGGGGHLLVCPNAEMLFAWADRARAKERRQQQMHRTSRALAAGEKPARRPAGWWG